MGRPPKLFKALTNAQRQADYRRREKEERLKLKLSADDAEEALQQANTEIESLMYAETDDKVRELVNQYHALKVENENLKATKNELAEMYRELKITNAKLTMENSTLKRQLREALAINRMHPSRPTPTMPPAVIGKATVSVSRTQTESDVLDSILKLKEL